LAPPIGTGAIRLRLPKAPRVRDANKQGAATEAALQCGRFELNCPSATTTVLSSDFIQSAIQGPWVGGLQRAEYTVGVEGCNQPHHVRRLLSDRHRHLLRGEPPGPVPAIRRRPLGAESTPYGSRDSSGYPVVAYERDFSNGTDLNLQLRGPLMALGFVF